jgi:ferritin
MTEGISDNLRKVAAVNNDVFGKLQSVLESILEQSKNETALILNLKEQIEMEQGQRHAD